MTHDSVAKESVGTTECVITLWCLSPRHPGHLVEARRRPMQKTAPTIGQLEGQLMDHSVCLGDGEARIDALFSSCFRGLQIFSCSHLKWGKHSGSFKCHLHHRQWGCKIFRTCVIFLFSSPTFLKLYFASNFCFFM